MGVPTATTGGLGSGFQALIANSHKRAFERARGMQGDPDMDILRYTWSDQDLSKAVQGTKTLVANLTEISCLVNDFTKRIAEALGEDFQAGMKVFEYYPANATEKILESDYISWNSMRWKPTRIGADDVNGCYTVLARREED